jgi:hypothetical protein
MGHMLAAEGKLRPELFIRRQSRGEFGQVFVIGDLLQKPPVRKHNSAAETAVIIPPGGRAP